jgi:hypothetical protein
MNAREAKIVVLGIAHRVLVDTASPAEVLEETGVAYHLTLAANTQQAAQQRGGSAARDQARSGRPEDWCESRPSPPAGETRLNNRCRRRQDRPEKAQVWALVPLRVGRLFFSLPQHQGQEGAVAFCRAH